MRDSIKKIVFLTGGFIVGGNLINWGSLLPYIASYYYHLDPSTRISDFSLVPFIGFLAESFIALIISYLSVHLSIFNILLIFSTICCSGMFLSSFLTNPLLFSWIYGLSLGFLSGSICLPSVWLIWSEIPESKAATSGILLTGYSLGSVPFSMVFTMIVNPHNTKVLSINDHERMFPVEVAERVPMTLRWITASYLVCMFLGLGLLPHKGKVAQDEGGERKGLGLREIVRIERCWMLFLMMFLALACQAYAQILYRVIANRFINDDYYSAYVGMAAYICSGIGRGVFGYLFEKFYWKKIMSLVYLIQTLLMASLWFTLSDKFLYAFFMVFIHFLTSSFYNNILILTENAFPGDRKVISYICFSFIPAYFTPYFLEKFAEPYIGLVGCLIFLSFVMAIMFFLVIFYQDPKKPDFLLQKNKSPPKP